MIVKKTVENWGMLQVRLKPATPAWAPKLTIEFILLEFIYISYISKTENIQYIYMLYTHCLLNKSKT